MVARARAREAAAGTGNIISLPLTPSFFPTGSACFDLVISSFTLQWLEQWDRAVHEIFRVLKPGGIIPLRSFRRTDL